MNGEQHSAYSGADGERYLEYRASSITGRNQSLRASLFIDLGSPAVTVLDFGCGTGDVVSLIGAAHRIGVEIGAKACDLARAKGVEVFGRLEEIADHSVDIAISFHALEHVDDPLKIIQQLSRVVKRGGIVRLIVPAELPLSASQKVWREDQDRHLYSWTPKTFGNLAVRAGLVQVAARLEPMPTESRLVKWLRWLPPVARMAHWNMMMRRNALNVVLNARTKS